MKRSDSYIKFFDRIFSPAGAAVWMWIMVAALAVPNVWLSMTEPLTVAGCVANMLLPAGIYILLAFSSAKAGRTVLWCFPLMFFAAFQMVLLYLYGRSVIAVDMFLNLVTTNPSEAGELLSGIAPIVVVVVVVFVPLIAAGIAEVVRKVRLGVGHLRMGRVAGIALSAAGLISLGVAEWSDSGYDISRDMYPVNVFNNIRLAVARTVKTARYAETSASYRFDAHSVRPDSVAELCIVVIGETSRAPEWQLTELTDAPTNPRLMNVGNLVVFPNALSESNTTHKSVPMLLSEARAETYDTDIYRVKSFITAFNEAGFHTAFISNQRRNRSFIDFFGDEAQLTKFIKEQPGAEDANLSDFELLPELDSIMARGADKQLVVLHTYGSHYNYADRYPRSMARFLPDNASDPTPAGRKGLLNAYRNSILVTDSLLSAIIHRAESSGRVASVIYTSDHGEDIFDDGRALFLHASPMPSMMQIHVPIVMWVSPKLAGLEPRLLECARANSTVAVSPSEHFFHTVLRLGGISTRRYDPERDLTSPQMRPAPGLYLDDHNRAVPLSSLPL